MSVNNIDVNVRQISEERNTFQNKKIDNSA